MKKTYPLFSMFLLSLIGLILLIPLIVTFIYSVFVEWTSILPSDFTIRYYIELFSTSEFMLAIVRSILISFISVCICTVVLLGVLYVMYLYLPCIEQYVEIICNIPYALQGVVLAVGILSLYAGVQGIFSNRVLILIGAYCIMILPYVYRGLKNTIDGVPVKCMIESAQVLGCSKVYGFIRIIIPQMKNGILSTMVLAFAMIFADFALVNIIAGSSFQTVGIFLYQTMSKSGQLSSTVIVILFMITLGISSMTFIIQDKFQGKRSR